MITMSKVRITAIRAQKGLKPACEMEGMACGHVERIPRNLATSLSTIHDFDKGGAAGNVFCVAMFKNVP
jgi:hypothetical protein